MLETKSDMLKIGDIACSLDEMRSFKKEILRRKERIKLSSLGLGMLVLHVINLKCKYFALSKASSQSNLLPDTS